MWFNVQPVSLRTASRQMHSATLLALGAGLVLCYKVSDTQRWQMPLTQTFIESRSEVQNIMQRLRPRLLQAQSGVWPAAAQAESSGGYVGRRSG
eukprot:CAMPEP_0174717100 /NCGR_PEP_ID=MMETSP1094-20130205/25854_1 /TAXON_ID=156173 /ORGANISM="Chrysochromulina brevifilum, Strain UTEX LB 985" /LENGTH=93 /DNA_ID=CAMNT_0015916991 /DNA_START=60 /DNA_END=341 /DNA_ORIENTATION=+